MFVRADLSLFFLDIVFFNCGRALEVASGIDLWLRFGSELRLGLVCFGVRAKVRVGVTVWVVGVRNGGRVGSWPRCKNRN